MPQLTSESKVPFSVIDQAIHLLDVPTAPWSIQLEARIDGHLDETRLRSAIATALGRHPMARARKLPSRLRARMDNWAIEPSAEIDALRVVDCPDDESVAAARVRLQGISVPLTESPPLRIVLARRPGGDLLMLNVNHAAMDGFGAVRVLRSIALAYTDTDTDTDTDTADPIPALDIQQAREAVGQLNDRPSVRIRRQLVLAARLRDLPAPPARVAAIGAADDAGYGFVHSCLTESQTDALVQATAENAPATVNDVLLAALHLAIADWNAQHRSACRRICVLVPANLRPAEWRNEIAGNFSLPSRISTNRRQRRSSASTLDAITAQTRRKKQYGMGTAFTELLGGTRLLPLWAKRGIFLALPLTGNRMVDTAMLSNLGRVEDLPSFGSEAGQVSELWFSPPARMPLGLTIGAATVGGRLHLVLRYRYRQFDQDAAALFADVYVRKLQAFSGPVTVTADAPTPAPASRRRLRSLRAA